MLLDEAERYLVSVGETKALAEASLTATGFYIRCGYALKQSAKVIFGGVEFDAIEVEKHLTGAA